MLVRLSPIEPALVPLVPVVETDTVQVAVGAEPEGVTELIAGAVPPRLEVTRPKFEVVTFETGSEKATVQVSGPAFVGLVEARLIEEDRKGDGQGKGCGA